MIFLYRKPPDAHAHSAVEPCQGWKMWRWYAPLTTRFKQVRHCSWPALQVDDSTGFDLTPHYWARCRSDMGIAVP